VQVGTTDGGGTNELVNSAATAAIADVNDAPAGNVTISGTAAQNQTLTASNTLADADGLGTVSYQWQQSADSGATWSAITGATSATYTLTQAQVGRQVRALASYTDAAGTVERMSSTATAAIANVNDAPSGSGFWITGNLWQGQTMRITHLETLADADGLGSLSYQWQNYAGSWTNIAGATSSSYTLASTDVGRNIRLVVTYTDGAGTVETVAGPATPLIGSSGSGSNWQNGPTGSIALNGTATQGQTLTASSTLADVDGLGTLSYQWQSSGDGGSTWKDIAGATASSYMLAEADVGTSVRVRAAYTDGLGTHETAVSAASQNIVNINDAATGTLAIAGTPRLHHAVTASHTLSDPDGIGAVSYQWQNTSDDGSSWTSIAGATDRSYTITANEVGMGRGLRVVATYIDGHGSVDVWIRSIMMDPSAAVNTGPSGDVTFAGTPTQGQLLTASNTLSDVDVMHADLAYKWQSSSDGGTTWTDIAGATGSTYTLAQAEVGNQVRVVASYTDGWWNTETVASSASAVIANANDASTGSVTISGTAAQSQTLTASHTLADEDGLRAPSWQWQSSADGGATWDAIAGATAASYTLRQGDVGRLVRVRAAYIDGWGSAESVASAATAAVANVNDAPGGNVRIVGQSIQNRVLTAQPALVDADALGAFAYQWQSSADPGSTWSDIAGATAGTYALTQGEVGRLVRVVVAYTDGAGTEETVASAATAAIANVNDAPTGSVTLLGDATQHQTLTASANLSDPDGALSLIGHRWQTSYDDGATWRDIAGAAGAGYTLTQADVGQRVRVEAAYVDATGVIERVFSDASAEVANVNDAPQLEQQPSARVAVTGQPFNAVLRADSFSDEDGDALTRTVTLADGSPLPAWLSFDAATRRLSGTPSGTDAGMLNLRFRATDPSGATAFGEFTLDVRQPTVTGGGWLAGGAGNDVLVGNEQAQTLQAGAGDDILIGGPLYDTLYGGTGSDTYFFNRGDAQEPGYNHPRRDYIVETQASGSADVDRLIFGHDISASQLWFSRSGNDLLIDVIGTCEGVQIANWYTDTANQMEAIRSGDGWEVLNSQVDQLVNAMASMTPPPAGQTTPDMQYYASLLPTMVAAWQPAG
jgi:predicted glycoside hydrolase/deacetylase ChbG (UPF0249 family)